MASRVPIRPEGIHVSPYFSPAIRVGQLLFISGQAATDAEGRVVGPGNCVEQSECVMQRISTILEAAGASLKDVVKTTTFLTSVDDYGAYNYVRSKFFSEDPPASSTVIVAALVRPELLVEVEAVAVIPDGGLRPAGPNGPGWRGTGG